MHNFATTWRLRTYSRLLLVPLFLPIAIAILAADGASTINGRLGGDFPAFYSAGLIVHEGRIDQLYDYNALTEAQSALKPSGMPTFRFAYPPFVAQVYSQFAKVPYRYAYAIHMLAMFTCLASAIALLAQLLPVVRRWSLEAFACAAAFYPMYWSITNGQNSALIVLILAAVFWAIDRERPGLAGGLAGLLLFKPQFAVPVVGLLMVRNWRSGVGFSVTAAVIWSWNALLAGENWIQWWLANMANVWGFPLFSDHPESAEVGGTSHSAFNDSDFWANGAHSVNFIGVSERIFGVGSLPAYLVGGVCGAAMAFGLIWAWRSRNVDLDLLFSLMACGMVLIPPHVMFYDSGLLLVPVAILANRHGRSLLGRLVLIAVLAFQSSFAASVGISLLFPAAALLLLWTVLELRNSPAISWAPRGAEGSSPSLHGLQKTIESLRALIRPAEQKLG